MTTRSNETTRISSFDCDHQPMGSQPDNTQTTEERLTDVSNLGNYSNMTIKTKDGKELNIQLYGR